VRQGKKMSGEWRNSMKLWMLLGFFSLLIILVSYLTVWRQIIG